MDNEDLCLNLLANTLSQPVPGKLEDRMHHFLRTLLHSESLDDRQFSDVNGSGSTADYLLSDRTIVAEMKTLNGDPVGRIEKGLRGRFALGDAPLFYGQLGVDRALQNLSDSERIRQVLASLAGRAVRQHLTKADSQIAATKHRFGLHSASGLAILMNEDYPLIDAAAIAYVVRSAFTEDPLKYQNITHVWAIVEAHEVMTRGGQGYPQLFIFRHSSMPRDVEYIARMTNAWGEFNRSKTEHIDHQGQWTAFRPIHKGGTPIVEIY